MDPNVIMNTIKEGGIRPISKKYFILKRYLVIGLGALVTIMGAIVFAKIVASLLAMPWESWDYVWASRSSFLYTTLPILWIGLLIVFITLIPFIIEKTKQGYKYKKIILVLFSIISSIVLGIIFLSVGSISGTNKFLVGDVVRREASVWTSPESGRISGRIVTRSTDSVILEDLRSRIWAVDITNILAGSRATLDSNENVRIIGIEVDENTFVACQVMAFPEIDKHFLGSKNTIKIRPSLKHKSELVDDLCYAILGDSY